MNTFASSLLFLLRISMGWLLFYSGITKVLDPEWSAEGFLLNASTFPEFYQWFAGPQILPIANLLNEWGLTLLGISLITGVLVRVSGILGALLILLYYFPHMDFPYVGANSYIVSEHIIYALSLLLLSATNAGKIFGLAKKFPRLG